jgi:sugar O-acyltransferase (sialic acid O-acetyltransferase NeuD family)
MIDTSACFLVGAGGHAKAIVETLRHNGYNLKAYIDPREVNWLDAEWIKKEQDVGCEAGVGFIGIGGVKATQLQLRLDVLRDYHERGFEMPALIHHQAKVSKYAKIANGVIILAGAIIQPGASIDVGAIVNTGAIVEHDSHIGSGAHIAPGSIVLGGADVGDCCMIGAGAVILPECKVESDQLVPALTRFSSLKLS